MALFEHNQPQWLLKLPPRAWRLLAFGGILLLYVSVILKIFGGTPLYLFLPLLFLAIVLIVAGEVARRARQSLVSKAIEQAAAKLSDWDSFVGMERVDIPE